jgi:hypothetical protein
MKPIKLILKSTNSTTINTIIDRGVDTILNKINVAFDTQLSNICSSFNKGEDEVPALVTHVASNIESLANDKIDPKVNKIKLKMCEIILKSIWPPISIRKSDMGVPLPSDKEYIAGFLDGYISMGERSKAIYVGFTQVGTDQSPPQVLKHIQYFIGGTISDAGRASIKHKRIYKLKIYESSCLELLTLLSPYLIIKLPQALVAIKYLTIKMQLHYIQLDDSLRVSTYNQLCTLKHEYEYRKVDVDPSRVTVSYLAGFFDAEGCVSATKSNGRRNCCIIISQWGCKNILNVIETKYGLKGRTSGGDLTFSSKMGCKLLLLILPYSIYKKPQIELFLELIDLLAINVFHRSDDQETRIDFLIKTIKQLKDI